MTRTTPLMDDSLEAIRLRVAESVTWPNAELAAALGNLPVDVPPDVSDALWRAVQDRRLLLEALDDLVAAGYASRGDGRSITAPLRRWLGLPPRGKIVNE